MPGQRSVPRRRARGSWTPRIIGIVLVLAAAAAAAAAILLASPGRAAGHANRLSAKVRSVQASGLVDPGPPGGSTDAPQALQATAAGLVFAPVPRSQLAAGSPQWTADLMADGTYIFIYAPDGQCLSAAGAGRRPAVLTLRRCDLGDGQRWRQRGSGARAGGHIYYQFAGRASGLCITAGGPEPGAAGARAAGLAACTGSGPWEQQIAFWWTS
ncbi:MAG: RICIN domain-containing protein [Streptosporangiaceae bacterium]